MEHQLDNIYCKLNIHLIKYGGKDTGRTLDGTMSGTLIGIYPKIILTFRKLTKEEMNIIAPILDSGEQIVKYYDPSLNQTVTLRTYTGDWGYTNKKIVEKNDSSFDISFISIEKRR